MKSAGWAIALSLFVWSLSKSSYAAEFYQGDEATAFAHTESWGIPSPPHIPGFPGIPLPPLPPGFPQLPTIPGTGGNAELSGLISFQQLSPPGPHSFGGFKIGICERLWIITGVEAGTCYLLVDVSVRTCIVGGAFLESAACDDAIALAVVDCGLAWEDMVASVKTCAGH